MPGTAYHLHLIRFRVHDEIAEISAPVTSRDDLLPLASRLIALGHDATKFYPYEYLPGPFGENRCQMCAMRAAIATYTEA